MATSSILGGIPAPVQSRGRDTGALGPSDSSDSGSDVQGERAFDALEQGEIGGDRADLSSDTDASGTGARGAAVYDGDAVEGADIAPDRIGVFGGRDAADPAGVFDDTPDPDIDALAADDDDSGALDENGEDLAGADEGPAPPTRRRRG